ncbi:hypothetical protein FA10DRAFT_268126 [Acaromyces ingoldii]|uniref:Uncharacterized protein n=1 Tax=Acaromyces ingoldii TaxID=215250 RepID=A0A316YJ87_9BASI|nr:hypothetical protein FA10DRAFT_268126 [Acaromyces ingoldii]PWN89600.1 hypothetical protein FA10DRAFT_268126 [Acaromyces ingoldii]
MPLSESQGHEAAGGGDGGYFGSGSVIITDSPSSSPSLGASHYSTAHKQQQQQQQIQQPAQARHTQVQYLSSWRSTPDVSDVPSLSLSNSSFSATSDAPLPSPGGRGQLDYEFIETLDRIRRVAYRLALPVAEVQRIVDVAQRLANGTENAALDDSLLLSRYGLDAVVYRAVLEAMRSDQEQQRSPAVPSARATLEMLSTPHPSDVSASPPSSAPSFPSMQQWGPATSARRQRWITSSPTSTYGQQQQLQQQHQHQQQQQLLRTPPFHPSRSQAPTHTQNHTLLPSYSYRDAPGRLRSLPTRSHRSMDDYTSTLTTATDSSISQNIDHHTIHHLPPAAPSLHGLFSQQASLVSGGRMTSPRIDEERDRYAVREDTLKQPSSRQSTATKPPQRGSSTSQLVASPSSASCASPSLSGRKASRRASADVLGLSMDHGASPSGASRASSPASASAYAFGAAADERSGSKLSHDEIMAKLQRKVKERIAAKAAAALTGAGSPSMGSSNSGSSSKPSSRNRSRSRPPRPKTTGDGQTRGSSRGMSVDEEARMNVDEDPRSPAGIEALLSAAAIADHQRLP